MTYKKCPKCGGRKMVYFHEIANFNALAQGEKAIIGERRLEYPCPICDGKGWVFLDKHKFIVKGKKV